MAITPTWNEAFDDDYVRKMLTNHMRDNKSCVFITITANHMLGQQNYYICRADIIKIMIPKTKTLGNQTSDLAKL